MVARILCRSRRDCRKGDEVNLPGVTVHISDGLIPNMTELMRRSIWVLGIRYVAAAHVQQYRDGSTGYIFHTEYSDEDARMKNVPTEVPTVVHGVRLLACELIKNVHILQCHNL